MHNTGEKGLSQKTDRVHCVAVKVCPRMCEPRLTAVATSTKPTPKVYQPQLERRSVRVGALAALYTAAMYSSCGYPSAFNPLAVCYA